VGTRLSGPGPQQNRFAAYIEGLADAAGHADRHEPLKSYSAGLLLPGDRKSVEPMAARLAPDKVRQTHQSMHHLVADAPWDDDRMLAQVRTQVLPAMKKQGPVVAWIVDDTGIPKKGRHSVGVARQYCGQLGKQDNCQVAVSLSISTWSSSLPIAWRLYLPESWANDSERRDKAKVPREVTFQTKPTIALNQIRQAVDENVPQGVVLADAGYGVDTHFRTTLTELGLQYVVGIQSTATVREPGAIPTKAKTRLRRDEEHPPVTVKEVAFSLPPASWKNVTWRQGSQRNLKSRFAAVRVHPAHRNHDHAEEWLLMEWPKGASEPTKYWLSTMPQATKLKDLVKMAKHRWIIERDYEELKQELGLGHYEGRGWRGFHHHATLCIAAYGFLVSERNRFSPSAHVGNVGLRAPKLPPGFRPRGAPDPA
jgi:SRSO17 transposase